MIENNQPKTYGETWDVFEATVANVYIVSKATPGVRSGYGVVIERQGATEELDHAGQTDETPARLLLKACLAALDVIPQDVPVRVIAAETYLTVHTVSRLGYLMDNGFRAANRKPVAHRDLVEALAIKSLLKEEVGASLTALTVPEVKWTDHHRRAQAIAVCHGGEGVAYPAKKKGKAVPEATHVAPILTTNAEGMTVADYGKAGDGEVLPW